jgi:hypothetical protein
MKSARSAKRREAIARRVVQGMKVLSVKLMDLEEDIRALWSEFEGLKDGETIMGCSTKQEFCIKILDRTPRAVRYMLTGGNPVANRAGETVSPSDGRGITEVCLKRLGHLDNWREFCQKENWHPLANALPLMDDDALDSLSEDIKKNGLWNPVVIFQGKVLDGRNRLLASAFVDKAPEFYEWVGTDPTDWVMSQNMYRRNMSITEECIAFSETGAQPLGDKRLRYNHKFDAAKEVIAHLVERLKIGEMTVQTAIAKMRELADGKAIREYITLTRAAWKLYRLMPPDIFLKAYHDSLPVLAGHETLEEFKKCFARLEDTINP